MVKNEETKGTGKVYEIGYLLVPTLALERIALEAGTLKDLVVKYGGILIAEEEPKLRDLAYEMKKVLGHKRETFSTSYFGWMKFEMEQESISSLKKELDLDVRLVRYLLIETVRENTLASRRPAGEGRSRRAPGKSEGMSEEEMNKTVEALVAEEAK